jgi:uncharacterized protein (TIGR02679 family)
LRMHKSVGEPCRVTLRQLLRDPPVLGPANPRVFVCENPSVVNTAADRLGAHGQPLVCVDGQPKTAVRVLLSSLSRHGSSLRYHGDFDWPGIQISNLIFARHAALPWRMGVTDYRSAPKGVALEGAPATANWDDQLGAAMQAAGRAVHEEQVMDLLLQDLATI